MKSWPKKLLRHQCYLLIFLLFHIAVDILCFHFFVIQRYLREENMLVSTWWSKILLFLSCFKTWLNLFFPSTNCSLLTKKLLSTQTMYFGLPENDVCSNVLLSTDNVEKLKVACCKKLTSQTTWKADEVGIAKRNRGSGIGLSWNPKRNRGSGIGLSWNPKRNRESGVELSWNPKRNPESGSRLTLGIEVPFLTWFRNRISNPGPVLRNSDWVNKILYDFRLKHWK